jgi:phosphate:Na+ symporter
VSSFDLDSMIDDEHRRLEAALTFALNLESAGDVVERNISEFAAKILKRGVELSPGAELEVEEKFGAVRSNLRSAASVFMTGDARAARALTQQKAEFRRREGEAIKTYSLSCATRIEPRRPDVAIGSVARHQEAQRLFGGGRGLSGARSKRRSHAQPDHRRGGDGRST